MNKTTTRGLNNDIYTFKLSGSRNHEVYIYKNGEHHFKIWNQDSVAHEFETIADDYIESIKNPKPVVKQNIPLDMGGNVKDLQVKPKELSQLFQLLERIVNHRNQITAMPINPVEAYNLALNWVLQQIEELENEKL